MHRLFLIISLSLLIFIFAESRHAYTENQPHIKRNIVKIFTTYSSYNYDQPWQMRPQQEGTGSGAIIAHQRILTNAHVIRNHTFIQVKRSDQARKYTAKVIQISHASDLALLTVEDTDFFADTQALDIGALPQTRDKVSVYGFPRGGTELSITEGVVSRIEHNYYAHSSAYLLTCQIDAAINPGNSGGPIIQSGKISGVAFQAINSGENIGYMVPAPVINHFLNDLDDGHFDGIPELGLHSQKMENPDLRQKYQLSQNQSGILVNMVSPNSALIEIIEADDILLSIQGYPIENDGSIEFRPGERTYYEYAIQLLQLGQSAQIHFLRQGTLYKKKFILRNPIHSSLLVPREQYNQAPSYFILGGLLFSPLSKDLLREWGNHWYNQAPKNLLYYYYYGKKQYADEQVVVLTKILADEINAGYQSRPNLIVKTVNGKPILNMKDLVAAFENNTEAYHTIISNQGQQLILDQKKVEKQSNFILQRYKIPNDRSIDLARPKTRNKRVTPQKH